MNTVAHPPQSDGKQPAGEAHSSRRTLLAAPLFTNPLGMASVAVNPSPAHVSPPASQAILGSDRANVGGCHEVTCPIDRKTVVFDMTGETSLAAREGDQVAAPFPTPQASSSQAAGQLASNAGDCVPPSLFDPAFLAATRESQGQPIDAEPRA